MHGSKFKTIKILKSIIIISCAVFLVDMLFFVGAESFTWGAGITDINKAESPRTPKGNETPRTSNKEDKGKSINDSKEDGANTETPEQVAYLAAKERGFLILVNKQNPMTPEYKPDDLVAVEHFAENREKICSYLRGEARDHFELMAADAEKSGHTLLMTSGYRSYNYQQVLWDNYIQSEGEAAAAKYSAKPGESEHQTGLAADVTSPGVNYELENEFGQTPEGLWMLKNAHKYGFILRYPKGKELITGYVYEPWHIRYVGKAVAAEIYKKGITLEEYVAEKNQ